MTDRKVCLGCGVEKLLSDYGPRKRDKFGRKSRCFECDAADCRAAYAADPDRAKAKVRKWQAKNPGKHQQITREWVAANRERYRELERLSRARVLARLTPEQRKEHNTRWYRKNKEVSKRKTAAWRAEHPDVMRRSRKKWEQNNPEKVALNSFNMQCKRRGAAGPGMSKEEWSALLDRCGHRCFYCLRHESESGRLHKEHVVPLKRGGINEPSNIVPACKDCNLRKAAKPLERILFLFMAAA